MRNAVAILSLASVCLALAGTARSQSLAEVAKKEKARRAQISQTREDTAVAVVDERALRNANGSTFAGVEVTGARERADLTGSATAPPVNPNRATTAPPTKSAQKTSRPSTPTVANTELAKGWSKKNEPPPGGKGWNPRRKEILESMGRTIEPIHPRTVQERDRIH